MYFSLITPVPGQERQAVHQWMLGNAYAEHQWLWQFFPAPAGTVRDFLFRRRDQEGIPRFYVVSQRKPACWPSAWQVQCQPYHPKLEKGDWLAFELRANPVVTHSRAGQQKPNGKCHGKRHDVIIEAKKTLLAERGLSRWQDWRADRCSEDGTPDPRPELYQLAQEHAGRWLEKRGGMNGFSLLSERLQVEAYQQHTGKNGQLHLSTVDFKGILQVTDPDLFVRKALMQGIGHAKAFGCGLLLVRRL